jgi:hypothetical protein
MPDLLKRRKLLCNGKFVDLSETELTNIRNQLFYVATIMDFIDYVRFTCVSGSTLGCSSYKPLSVCLLYWSCAHAHTRKHEACWNLAKKFISLKGHTEVLTEYAPYELEKFRSCN